MPDVVNRPGEDVALGAIIRRLYEAVKSLRPSNIFYLVWHAIRALTRYGSVYQTFKRNIIFKDRGLYWYLEPEWVPHWEHLVRDRIQETGPRSISSLSCRMNIMAVYYANGYDQEVLSSIATLEDDIIRTYGAGHAYMANLRALKEYLDPHHEGPAVENTPELVQSLREKRLNGTITLIHQQGIVVRSIRKAHRESLPEVANVLFDELDLLLEEEERAEGHLAYSVIMGRMDRLQLEYDLRDAAGATRMLGELMREYEAGGEVEAPVWKKLSMRYERMRAGNAKEP